MSPAPRPRSHAGSPPRANEFGSTTSRVAVAKTNLNAARARARARARESDSAERKATADQLIARPLSFRSRHPTSAGAKLSFSRGPGPAPRDSLDLARLLLTRARPRASVHLRIAVMRSTRSATRRSRPINRAPFPPPLPDCQG